MSILLRDIRKKQSFYKFNHKIYIETIKKTSTKLLFFKDGTSL
jgi:hypothetical protein